MLQLGPSPVGRYINQWFGVAMFGCLGVALFWCCIVWVLNCFAVSLFGCCIAWALHCFGVALFERCTVLVLSCCGVSLFGCALFECCIVWVLHRCTLYYTLGSSLWSVCDEETVRHFGSSNLLCMTLRLSLIQPSVAIWRELTTNNATNWTVCPLGIGSLFYGLLGLQSLRPAVF